jgi:6-pyruvoyltetrahydropterin/6-carboxytetrahydropterin synthase
VPREHRSGDDILAGLIRPDLMQITCRLEFDSGHRIPQHQSQCQHLHGHRYAIEITLSGDIIDTVGSPREGMVMDFSDVKGIARREIVEAWDHAFLVHREDRVVVDFLNSIPGHKTVVLARVPTAENLAIEAFGILHQAYQDWYGNHLSLERVRLYETPNSWADAMRSDTSLA